MKTTFVATVLNEEENISKLLDSILSQTKKVDETIIIDGGSVDKTVSIVKKYKWVKLLRKKGNRAIGRNLGIKKATGEIILISDSGCVLDKNWVKNIIEPFERKEVDVVAGFYSSKAESDFEKSLVPYVLVMPDKVNSKTFLPSARSMAIRKEVLKGLGGFPEKYAFNEDYVFAKMLKENVRIEFKKNAIIFWIPRKNIFEGFIMFFKFAAGDAQSGILRPKVILIFIRYMIGLILILESLVFSLLIILYFIWAVFKNYRYVRRDSALFYLPLLQITSDFAVITGTIWGTLKRQ